MKASTRISCTFEDVLCNQTETTTLLGGVRSALHMTKLIKEGRLIFADRMKNASLMQQTIDKLDIKFLSVILMRLFNRFQVQ